MTTLILTITLSAALSIFAIDALRKRREFLNAGKK